MVMTALRSMEIAGDRIVLEAMWPEGTRYHYVLGREGVSVEGFPDGGRMLRIRRRGKRITAVEHPAGPVTLLLADPAPWWARVGWRLGRFAVHRPSPCPLDDSLLGTSWDTIDLDRLYRELERLGFRLQRTDWDRFLLGPQAE